MCWTGSWRRRMSCPASTPEFSPRLPCSLTSRKTWVSICPTCSSPLWSDRIKIVIIVLVPINVLHIFGVPFRKEYILCLHNTCGFNLACTPLCILKLLIFYACKYCFFVIHVWHPCFPLNEKVLYRKTVCQVAMVAGELLLVGFLKAYGVKVLFQNCTCAVVAGELLLVGSLKAYVVNVLFQNCMCAVVAGELLLVSSLKAYVVSVLFQNCTCAVVAGELLLVGSLKACVVNVLFQNCTCAVVTGELLLALGPLSLLRKTLFVYGLQILNQRWAWSAKVVGSLKACIVCFVSEFDFFFCLFSFWIRLDE